MHADGFWRVFHTEVLALLWPCQQIKAALDCMFAQLQTSTFFIIIALWDRPVKLSWRIHGRSETKKKKRKKRLPIKKHCYVPLIGFPLSSAMKSSGLTENLTPKGQDDAAWRKRRSLYKLWAEEKRVWPPGHGLSLPGERSDYQSTLMIKER